MDNNNDIPVDLTNEQSIDLFIEGLIEEKGLKVEGNDVHTDIFNDLKTRLMEEIDRSLVSELPDGALDDLSKQIAANDGKIAPEIVAEKIAEAGINTEEVVGKTMAKFKDIYLGTEENGAE